MNAPRISRLEVSNFKSLVDFQLDLPKFTCLIGLNGCGKSTVLQCIDFVSQLLRGDMKEWLEERRWKGGDLKSKLLSSRAIKFKLTFCDMLGQSHGFWIGRYNTAQSQCDFEGIYLPGFRFRVSNGVMGFLTNPTGDKTADRMLWRKQPITFKYVGSILSALKRDLFPPEVYAWVDLIKQTKSLDLLSPESLRQRTRASSGNLGRSGQNLAAFIYEMSPERRAALVAKLRVAYPRLTDLYAKTLRSGWKQLEFLEAYPPSHRSLSGTQPQQRWLTGMEPEMTTEARHINDGLLRILAILAELDGDNRFLLFDEIENGINPELVEFLVKHLVDSRQQVLVTTHSPMILNYLDDDVARSGVIYLYKTPQGHTKSIPFFSIPSLQKKLEVMGPGEAFVDTNLTELADEITGMSKEEA
jgi:ABC-type branched-subunit amino acid transport system ATPase component